MISPLFIYSNMILGVNYEYYVTCFGYSWVISVLCFHLLQFYTVSQSLSPNQCVLSKLDCIYKLIGYCYLRDYFPMVHHTGPHWYCTKLFKKKVLIYRKIFFKGLSMWQKNELNYKTVWACCKGKWYNSNVATAWALLDWACV